VIALFAIAGVTLGLTRAVFAEPPAPPSTTGPASISAWMPATAAALPDWGGMSLVKAGLNYHFIHYLHRRQGAFTRSA